MAEMAIVAETDKQKTKAKKRGGVFEQNQWFCGRSAFRTTNCEKL
jgi:hypothetical protein